MPIPARLSLLAFAIALVAACVPVKEEQAIPLDLRQDNPVIRHIEDLQLAQRRDSLLAALTSANPTERFAAARAFASFQDTSVLDALVPLLLDQHGEVRAMAAYAIGQLGIPAAETALTSAFDGKDSARLYHVANSAILEAVGKLGSAQYLYALSTITSYQPGDTLLLLGQMRGIYRYALRNLTDPEGTATMVSYLSDPAIPLEGRIIAANYLHRAQGIDLKPHTGQLKALWLSETHPYLRMCLATALGKLKTEEALDLLLQSVDTETDYRVRCNILRALQPFAYETVSEVFLRAAKSDDPALAELGGEYFLKSGRERDAAKYKAASAECPTWQGAARLAEAANRQVTNMFSGLKQSIAKDIEARLAQASDPYAKAAWLKAWAGEPRNFESLQRYMQPGQPAPVRLQAVTSLIEICTMKGLDAFFPGEVPLIRAQIGGYLGLAIKSGDPGLLAFIASGIADPESNLKTILADKQADLNKALAGLKLPEALEAYQEIAKALQAYGVDAPVIPDEERNVKPVDWALIDQLGPDAKVKISTNKGDILVSLFPERAPQTVSAFAQLVKSGFYNGKAFHRVVPNFVIQTGCPRGDGYGSLDFTIRSELAGSYYDQEGYVGMASAGPHTEGTQFFITHAPAPHLDGRYTIFGRVISGMDIVHRISVGDVIRTIELIQ
jgi:cyclophilin family peptidyl-prolyl cis-trans isomerase/HEAT repeat protein